MTTEAFPASPQDRPAKFSNLPVLTFRNGQRLALSDYRDVVEVSGGYSLRRDDSGRKVGVRVYPVPTPGIAELAADGCSVQVTGFSGAASGSVFQLRPGLWEVEVRDDAGGECNRFFEQPDLLAEYLQAYEFEVTGYYWPARKVAKRA